MRASDFTPDIHWGQPKLTRHHTIHKRTARRLLAAFGAGALIGAAITLAPPAKADPTSNYINVYGPTVCTLLERNTSLQGVTAIGNAITADGFGPDAGRIIVEAVDRHCPRFWPLLEQYAAIYANDGHTGGRLV